MLEMRLTHGEWHPKLKCWCGKVCTDPAGWIVIFDHHVAPAMCCGPECAQAIRDAEPERAWQAQPLGQFLLDLTLQYGADRRSARCGVCLHPERRLIDSALVQHTATQREVACRYGFAKGSVYNHATGHVPVAAALAARGVRK
jgi:hypothetical protein